MLDLIFGRREEGKSTLANYISRQSDTRVIFDPRHMFRTTSDVLTDANMSENLYTLLNERYEVIIQPDFRVMDIFEGMCSIVRDWLRDNPQEKFSLLVDEARFIDTPNTDYPNFDYIVRCLPRENVTVIMTCHRPSDVAVSLRAIADKLFMFKITQEHDLKIVQQRCGQEVADVVQSLGKYEFVLWDDSIAKWKKVTDRASWYTSLVDAQKVEA